MKLRYRLIISFCIILFVPIIVAGIVLYGLSLLQDRANAQANGYDFIISSIQILNQSTASQYQELSRVAEDNPELLTDIEWLEGENRQLQANGAYLIVRVGDEIICNGDSSKTDIDVDRLPDFGDNEQAEQAAVFLEGSNPALVRQVDFVLEDGTQGTLFLVNTAKSILPEVRRVLLNLVLSILLILLFTAAVLIIWTYSGIVPRIKQLVTATRKIRDGNLNFTIETRGSDEISELSDALEAMRQRLEANAQEKLDAEQEQGQGMLAGKFPARAGALEDRPGQVGFDLVGFGAAAFAFAPYGVFVEAERRPLAGFEQSLRRLDGGGVRGEGQYRFGGEFHRLSCCRRPCGRFLKDRKKGGRRDGSGGTPLPLRGRPCSGARPASQAFLREHPTVLEAFCHNEGFPATRNPFQGTVHKKSPFLKRMGKRLFCWEGRRLEEGTTPSFQRGVSLYGESGTVQFRRRPRQHSGHEPEHGNEGKGMAEARRVGDETDDRRAEQEAEEPDG